MNETGRMCFQGFMLEEESGVLGGSVVNQCLTPVFLTAGPLPQAPNVSGSDSSKDIFFLIAAKFVAPQKQLHRLCKGVTLTVTIFAEINCNDKVKQEAAGACGVECYTIRLKVSKSLTPPHSAHLYPSP